MAMGYFTLLDDFNLVQTHGVAYLVFQRQNKPLLAIKTSRGSILWVINKRIHACWEALIRAGDLNI